MDPVSRKRTVLDISDVDDDTVDFVQKIVEQNRRVRIRLREQHGPRAPSDPSAIDEAIAFHAPAATSASAARRDPEPDSDGFLRELLSRPITVFGRETTLAAECPFKDMTKMADVFRRTDVCCHVKQSVEQTQKSMAIGALCVMNAYSMAPKPAIVICGGCVKSSVVDVSKKIKSVLEPYKERLDIEYLDSTETITRFFANDTSVAKMRRGAVVPFVKAQWDLLETLQTNMQRLRFRGCLAIEDEFDAAMTRAREDAKLPKRERFTIQMYADATGAFLTEQSIVRTLVTVSATNVGTFLWLQKHGIPFVADVVSPQDLRANGFATYEDLVPMKAADGTYVFLPDGMRGADKLGSPQVAQMTDAFSEETRDYPMMQVAISSFTKATGDGIVNMRQTSDRIQTRFRARNNGRDDLLAIFVVTGDGLFVAGGATADFDVVYDNKYGMSMMILGFAGGRRPVKASFHDAICQLERRRDPRVKLVVIGMACLLRSVSLLGPFFLYTITHIVCVPADGMSAANIQQLVMRHGGRTLERRRERGYECVTVLMSRSDWQLVRSLYDLTAELLRMCGTGTREGLRAWQAVQFEPRYKAVIETARKHSEPSVDPHKVIKKLPVAAPEPAPAVAEPQLPDAVPPYQGHMWQELVIQYFRLTPNGGGVFTQDDYTEEIRRIRTGDHRMSHKNLKTKGLVVDAGRVRGSMSYHLTPRGVEYALAYMQARGM